MAIGSCYCEATDKGAEHWSVLKSFGLDNPLRLRVLCGDQVYLDLSQASGNPIIMNAPNPWERYPEHWESRRFRAFLAALPTVVLADDHEFWNDYPHGNAYLLWDESQPNGPLGQKMNRAFAVFQAALNLDPAAVVDDGQEIDRLLSEEAPTFLLDLGLLQLFVLDTRTRRTRYDASRPRFTAGPWLQRAIQWIQNLTTPGVLLVSQPMVEQRTSWFKRKTHTMGDVNLPDYDEDFADLWEAILAAGHDVLVVSGDIHWSRLYQIARPLNPGREVFEFISSPLARIPFGTPGLGEANGKVEWQRSNGTAYWTRYADCADNSDQLYGTLTLTPQGAAVGSPVKVEAVLWGLPPGVNNGPVRLRVAEFTLR